MKNSKAVEIIKFVDESRRSKWKLAVDENCKNLLGPLVKIGFNVASFQSGLSDEDVNRLLIKNKVNYFITRNGEHFLKYIMDVPTRYYSMLWVDSKISADIQLTVKAIEGSILYDPEIKLPHHSYVRINRSYITELPRKKLKSKLGQRKNK